MMFSLKQGCLLSLHCNSTSLTFFFFSHRSWYGCPLGDGGSGGSYSRTALGEATPRCQPLYWTHWDGPTHHKIQQPHRALCQWRKHAGALPHVGLIPQEDLPVCMILGLVLHCLMISCQSNRVSRAVTYTESSLLGTNVIRLFLCRLLHTQSGGTEYLGRPLTSQLATAWTGSLEL